MITRQILGVTPRPLLYTRSPICTAMNSAKFSSGSDPATLTTRLNPLLTTSGGRWTLTADGHGLERTFKFKTFAKTWDFMTAVSLQCKTYNTTFIRWTTHSPPGLSNLDVELAEACDIAAAMFGELEGEAVGSEASVGLSKLADQGKSEAGDCCVPKK